ncbi:ATP-binding protein [Micromonosporaceae bacterium Da 78-11]
MNPAEASWPPPGARDIRRWVLDTPAELRTLRSSLIEVITGSHRAGADALGEVAETMVVVATELATNALRHGLAPSTVRLSRTDDHFILDVADHDVRTRPIYDLSRPPGAGGLGLPLVRDLSDGLGWYLTATTKHVWARIPVLT